MQTIHHILYFQRKFNYRKEKVQLTGFLIFQVAEFGLRKTLYTSYVFKPYSLHISSLAYLQTKCRVKRVSNTQNSAYQNRHVLMQIYMKEISEAGLLKKT
jgi:hypothetical protein